MDFTDFNARWLKAWSDKDVPVLCAFYTEDCVYKDPQTPAGLSGNAALKGYLAGLFAATPPMTYTPDEVWVIPGGFCGRWYCEMGAAGRLRGFDLVILNGDKIALNEVYTHQIPA